MYLLAEEKSIELESMQAGPVIVLADEGRLKQVLVNLLDNAIKYTSPGGKVTVSVALSAGGRLALLKVTDTGIGIPAESLPHIFERFYRADKARTRESGGAGLGLSIVKAITNAHSGNIVVDSSEGQGTTVQFELPISMLSLASHSELQPSSSEPQHQRTVSLKS